MAFGDSGGSQARNTGPAVAADGGYANTGVHIGDVYTSYRVPARSAYANLIRQMGPGRELPGRAAELAELGRFCTDPTVGSYLWWQAPAWAGKSALMSWFARNPPAGVQVVSFFITGRFPGHHDRVAFTQVVVEQLAALLEVPVPNSGFGLAHDQDLLDLLNKAARRCADQDERLVLLVDGLDEDRGVTTRSDAHSIAALLPAEPPAGMKVVVAGRPSPPIPFDVPPDHPLRDPAVVRPLSRSPYAAAVRTDMERELRDLFDSDDVRRDLLGLLTAAGGGLSATDLAALTGGYAEDITALLSSVAGRTFTALPGGDGPNDRPVTYVLAHEELRKQAKRRFGPARLRGYLADLHDWADRYRDHWPPETPTYLLTGYFSRLHELRDLARMVSLATDPARHECLHQATGTDHVALLDIDEALEAVCRLDITDLDSVSLLVYYRHAMNQRNAHVPYELPAVWELVDEPERADALLQAAGGARRRPAMARALAIASARRGDTVRARRLVYALAEPKWPLLDVARALAAAEQFDDALELVRSSPDGDDVALGEVVVAEQLARAGQTEWAEALATSIAVPGQQVQALSGIAQAVADRGDRHLANKYADLAVEIATSITDDFWGSFAREHAAPALAAAGRLAEAVAMAGTTEFADWALRFVAEALVRAGELKRAEEIVRDQDAKEIWRVRAASVKALCAAGDLASAAAVSRKIYSGEHVIQALESLAPALAAAGRLSTAVRLAKSFTTRHWLKSGDWAERRREALIVVARAGAGAGDIDTAELALSPITDPYHRAAGITAMAHACALAGNTGGARLLTGIATELTRKADRQRWKSEVAIHLTRALVRSGDVAFARAVVSGLDDGTRPDEALHVLAIAAAQERDYPRARATAEAISEAKERERALLKIARTATAIGDLVEAERLLDTMDRTTGQAWATLDLARALARRRDVSHALALIRALPDEWQILPGLGLNGNWHETCLAHLVADIASTGDTTQADDLAAAITDDYQRALALVRLTGEAMRRGDLDRARTIAATAEHLARTMETNRNRGREIVLSDLARELAAMGDLDRAENVAHSMDVVGRDRALGGLVNAALAAGDLSRADRFTQWTYPDDDWQTPVLTAYAVACARQGDVPRAETVAGRLKKPSNRAAALVAVVRAAAELGAITEAERLARSIDSPPHQAEAFAALTLHDEPQRRTHHAAVALRAADLTTFLTLLPEIHPRGLTTIAERFNSRS